MISPSTCSSRFVVFPTNPVFVSEIGGPADVPISVSVSKACSLDQLRFSCTSSQRSEVRIVGITKESSDESIVLYRLTLIGVKDFVNGDGIQTSQVRCITSFGSEITFEVRTEDVLFPFFEFAQDPTTGESKTFLFAYRNFTIHALRGLSGPAFFPATTSVYLGVAEMHPLIIDRLGRTLTFHVPFSSLCTPSTRLDCGLALRVENSLDVGAVEDSKRVRYVKRSCHERAVCKKPVDDYRLYPSRECPVGHDGHCLPCPRGARCPGGSSVWSLPGFHTKQDPVTKKDVLVPCAQPASRCKGYVEGAHKQQCAPGYGGPLCGGCEPSFFMKPVGPRTCFQCPVSVSPIDLILVPLAFALVSMVLVFLLMTLVSFVILKRNGGTLKGGLSRSQEFVVYVCISLSLLSQVSRASLGKLPSFMNQLAVALAVFQLDVSGPVSPECTTYPFWREMSLFSMSSCCILFLVISFPKRCRLKFCRSDGATAVVSKLRHGIVFWLCISYPLCTNFVVKLVNCVPVGAGGNQTFVLQSNSLVRCNQGEHAGAFRLALVAGFLHVLLFPVVSVIIIFRVRRKYVPSWFSNEPNAFDQRPMWKYFLANSYLPQWFFVRQMELLFVLMATICNEFLAESNILAYLITYVVLLLVCCMTYLVSNPFVKEERWKRPVRLYSFLCIFVYALTNYLSSDLALANKELADRLVPILSFSTMCMCIVLFLILLICFIKSLADSAKREARLSRKAHKMSVIEFVPNPVFRPTRQSGSTDEQVQRTSLVLDDGLVGSGDFSSVAAVVEKPEERF